MSNLADVMDAIAAALVAVTPRTYGWPVGSVTPPCAVVGYPTNIDFDMTYQRGADKANFPIYFLAGVGTEKSARDALSSIITGAIDIKDVLDGDLDGKIQSGRVTDCKIEQIEVGSILYVSATFTYEAYI